MPSGSSQIVQAFGLRIVTEVRIPGAQFAGILPGPPDLHITLGEAHPPANARAAGTLLLAGTTLFIDVPGTARFLYRHALATLTVEPVAGAQSVSALLIATALPAVLWMRGNIMLHAAAAVLPGTHSAIAFAGPSGCGKSTLLRHLLAAGAHVVADDTISLDPQTLRIAGLPAITLARAAESAGITEVPIPEASQVASARLHAIIFLADPEPRNAALHGPAALAALLGNLHRPRVPRLLGKMPVLLPQLAALLPRLPLYSAHWDRHHLPSPAELQQLTTQLTGEPHEHHLGT